MGRSAGLSSIPSTLTYFISVFLPLNEQRHNPRLLTFQLLMEFYHCALQMQCNVLISDLQACTIGEYVSEPRSSTDIDDNEYN